MWRRYPNGGLGLKRVEEAGRPSGGLDQRLARPAVAGIGMAARPTRDHRLEWMMKSGGIEVVRRGLAAGTIRYLTELGA